MISDIVTALLDNIIIVVIIVCFTVYNITGKILDYKLEKLQKAMVQGLLDKMEIFKGE